MQLVVEGMPGLVEHGVTVYFVSEAQSECCRLQSGGKPEPAARAGTNDYVSTQQAP